MRTDRKRLTGSAVYPAGRTDSTMAADSAVAAAITVTTPKRLTAAAANGNGRRNDLDLPTGQRLRLVAESRSESLLPPWYSDDPASYFQQHGAPLRGEGKLRTAACPFHTSEDFDNYPVRVDVTTGAWRCTECGAGGRDVLAYHMQRHGLRALAAARHLRASSGRENESAWSTDLTSMPRHAVLQVIADDANLVAVAHANVAYGVVLSEVDREKVSTAGRRIGRLAAVGDDSGRRAELQAVLQLIAEDASLVVTAALNLGRGATLSDTDRAHLLNAAHRIRNLADQHA